MHPLNTPQHRSEKRKNKKAYMKKPNTLRKYILALLILISSSAQVATAESLIYIVDLQKIVAESKLGKSVQIKMRAKVDESQTQMAKAAQEIKALEEKMQKQSALLSASALEEKKQELLDKQKDFARQSEDKQVELQTFNRKYLTEVLKEVKSVLDLVAKERNYPIILEKDQKLVLYSDSKIDITSEVIQKLDQTKTSI